MRPEDAKRFPGVEVPLKNGGTAVIRPLAAADGEALAAFYAGVPREDIRFYCPHPLDRDHALANATKAESPVEVVLVCETGGGRIGGYAWFRWSDPAAARSTFGICIGRDLQGRGVGRTLMVRLAEIAESVGPPVMQLTVQLANARAVALYRSMGFRVVREQMRANDDAGYGFPPEPEYLMERETRKPPAAR